MDKLSVRACIVWLALLVAGIFAPGCSRSNLKADLDRSSLGDEDLVALLPRGLDAVLDVDGVGLRRLDTAAELLAFLPEYSLKRLKLICEQPLRDLDALAVGALGMGTGEAEVVWVARGAAAKLQQQRVFASIRQLGPTSEAEYHGLPLIETQAGQAAAMLTGRTVVFGSRQAVRQVIDIFRGDEEGVRSQPELMQALAKAPRAKEGRPAILLGILMTPPLAERLRQFGMAEFSTGTSYLSAAVAVGDGIDLGIVAGYRELAIAQEAAGSLQARAQALRQRPALRFIGIEHYVQPLVAVAVPPGKGRDSPELHLAYRLPSGDLAELLSRLAKLQRLRQRLRGGEG